MSITPPKDWWMHHTGDGQHWCRYQLIDQAKIEQLPGRHLDSGDLSYPCWYRFQLGSTIKKNRPMRRNKREQKHENNWHHSNLGR
jgi:hypothetical protein